MNNKIKKIANHYGVQKQCIQSMEECGELIQAIAKVQRSSGQDDIIRAKNHLYEEIADVNIMIEQLKYLLQLSGIRINNEMNNKLDRQIERIEKEN